MSDKDLNQTFYRSHYPNGMTACGFCFIWQPSFVKIIPLVASAILSTFFSIDPHHALKISLNHCDQTEVSSFFQFFQIFPKILTLLHISVVTQRFILSAIDLFVLTLVISFITRTFSSSARSFPHPISLGKLLN